MPGPNKEQVVFVAALALLAWEAFALVQGPGALPDSPKRPPKRALPSITLAELRVPAGDARWNPAGRNPFLPRQEFSDLPPAALPVPPAPPIPVVVGAPSPRPAAGVAMQFRQALAPAKPIDIDTPKRTDGDEGGR